MIENEIFDKKYRIRKTLGKGGMSKVYLAENIRLGTFWAIKEMRKSVDSKVDFLIEPNILKKLNHRALPRVFDILEDEQNVYIVVDFIEGISLDKELASNGRFEEEKVVDWAMQICEVLSYLHHFKPNPIIYRDMKPSNIMLTTEGSIKLIDFGIAREYKPDSENDTTYIGTRGYAAPEQYGAGQTNVRTDIYGLGVTLYCLLTGKSPNEPPYEIKPVRLFQETLSYEIEAIIGRCTKIDPSQRYQTIEDVLIDLKNVENKYFTKNQDNLELKSKLKEQAKQHGKAFKRLVATVWDNPEFGCELAYVIAKHTDLEVLIIDLDLLAPSADLLLSVNKYPNSITHHGENFHSGLNIVMECTEKNILTEELLRASSVKRLDTHNLHILTGNEEIENYEYYRHESLGKLIDKAYQTYDITLLLVNKSIYDAFTVISLMKSDVNLVAIPIEIRKLREFNRYILFLKEKQDIAVNKTKFIGFEYDEKALQRDIVEEVTGHNFLGSVAYSKKRIRYRNLKTLYARRMERKIALCYLNLLEKLNIMAKPSIEQQVKEWLGQMNQTKRRLKKAVKSFMQRRGDNNANHGYAAPSYSCINDHKKQGSVLE